MGLCFFVRDWIVIFNPKPSQYTSFPRGDEGDTYGIPIPPNTPKHLSSLHSPNPVLQQRIQQEINSNRPFHPYCLCGFPAQLAIEIKRNAGDCDGGISQDEADGGFGVVAGEGVGLGEGAEVGSKSVVGCAF